MGQKFVIPKTFKKAPDARLFFKCGILGLRYSIGVGARPMKFGNGAHVINKDDVIIYFPHARSGRGGGAMRPSL